MAKHQTTCCIPPQNIKIITWIWVTLVCFRLFAPTAAAIIEVSIVGIVKLIPPVLAGSTILDMLAICLKLKDKHCISHKWKWDNLNKDIKLSVESMSHACTKQIWLLFAGFFDSKVVVSYLFFWFIAPRSEFWCQNHRLAAINFSLKIQRYVSGISIVLEYETKVT